MIKLCTYCLNPLYVMNGEIVDNDGNVTEKIPVTLHRVYSVFEEATGTASLALDITAKDVTQSQIDQISSYKCSSCDKILAMQAEEYIFQGSYTEDYKKEYFCEDDQSYIMVYVIGAFSSYDLPTREVVRSKIKDFTVMEQEEMSTELFGW